jgi:hypothetical protein
MSLSYNASNGTVEVISTTAAGLTKTVVERAGSFQRITARRGAWDFGELFVSVRRHSDHDGWPVMTVTLTGDCGSDSFTFNDSCVVRHPMILAALAIAHGCTPNCGAKVVE